MWGARKHLTKELSIQGMISFERIYSFLCVPALVALLRYAWGCLRLHAPLPPSSLPPPPHTHTCPHMHMHMHVHVHMLMPCTCTCSC